MDDVGRLVVKVAAIQPACAAACLEDVGTAAAINVISALPAIDLIISRVTQQDIVSFIPLDGVTATAPIDIVTIAAPHQGICGGRAILQRQGGFQGFEIGKIQRKIVKPGTSEVAFDLIRRGFRKAIVHDFCQ